MVKAIGRPAASLSPPDVVEANGELACCNDRITPKSPGETDMRVFAEDLHCRIAEVAGHPGADANRHAGFDQLRGLLDMQLDKGFDRPGIEACLAPPHSLDAGAAFRHVFGKGAARIDTPCLECSRREHPEGRATADV